MTEKINNTKKGRKVIIREGNEALVSSMGVQLCGCGVLRYMLDA